MQRLPILLLSLSLLTAVDVPPAVTVSPTFLETLEVHVTSLDVIVTDRAGHPVAGLGREDFEIRDDSRPQEVTNFTEYNGSSSSTRLPAQADTLETPPERHFVFFIDEMSLHPQTRKKLLQNTLEFVKANMRPGDQAMIVTPASSEKLALAFSGERDAVAAKLTAYISNQTFRADTQTESEQFFLRSVASAVGTRVATRPYAERVNRRVTSTLRTLLGFVGGMAQTPGRKVVVLVTTSLTSHPGEEVWGARGSADYRPISLSFGARETLDEAVDRVGGKRYWFDATPMIRELGAIASANGITIYTVQPNIGFRISPPGAGADNASNGSFAVTPSQNAMLEGTGETLGMLAKATGGKYYLGEDKLDEAFGQLTSDVQSYYSIGYRTPTSGDGNIRKISVTVKGRNDLVVRTRRELMDRSPSREMDEQTAAALFAPPPVNELEMKATATSPKREGRSRSFFGVEVAVTFPLEKLTFVPADNGMYRASFAVHYAAADAADYTTGVIREETVQVAAADLDAALKKSYTYTTRLVVSPGTARVAVGVMDKASRLSSFERLVVEAR